MAWRRPNPRYARRWLWRLRLWSYLHPDRVPGLRRRPLVSFTWEKWTGNPAPRWRPCASSYHGLPSSGAPEPVPTPTVRRMKEDQGHPNMVRIDPRPLSQSHRTIRALWRSCRTPSAGCCRTKRGFRTSCAFRPRCLLVAFIQRSRFFLAILV